MHDPDDRQDDDAARLAQRSPLELARFIVSLRHAPDPLGEHVRTFMPGDDVETCASAIEARIAAFQEPAGRRAPRSRSIRPTLDYLLDDIEQLVLSINARRAFELLLQFIEGDAAAAENSTQEDWEIQQAFRRAIALLAQVAASVSVEQREQAAVRLLAEDSYGLRVGIQDALR